MLEQRCINAIRILSAEAVEKAKSGHPGMPMGMAAPAYVLWTKFMKHNPKHPKWSNRDRFVLSAGHGSMLLYSLLYLTGYELELDDLRQFRQLGSKTPGHPEYLHTSGVETTTGPLGQGFANAVGMALAEAHLGELFNRPGHPIVDHYTYVIASDGDLMEGISHEAASLAGHWKLGKLICLYDDNRISIEGSTALAFTEDTSKRFEGYGWQVLNVEDGNDIGMVEEALEIARNNTDQPTIIITRTQIGYGSPNKQNSASAHGEPLGEKELQKTKEYLQWEQDDSFSVPEDILNHFRACIANGQKHEQFWQQQFTRYAQEYPELSEQWLRLQQGKLLEQWGCELSYFQGNEKGMATRNASGQVLNKIAKYIPNLIGGSADLAPSTKTEIEGAADFSSNLYSGRNLRFGVREHGMGAILNGMALHGGTLPYGATFLVFSDYMKPSIRLAALMGLKVIYVFTHDSIGLGEDGPTHQPIEHLLSLRAIPGLTVIRPADANETLEAWRYAIGEAQGPVAFSLTRQNVPILDQSESTSASHLKLGAYILRKEKKDKPDAILIGTGSEVHIALEAASRLASMNIDARVVSMPSWELFDQQGPEYQELVLPADVAIKVSIEAGTTIGWERYTNSQDTTIGINRFGTSAPYQELYKEFGITVEAIIEKVKQKWINV
ncbi:transketolase [Desulfuribacillus stibiiarsenatis]|nr:transketolase [Desulfuribacillus stibiiarsenatis]